MASPHPSSPARADALAARAPAANPMRDCWCAAVQADRVDEHVRLAGWVHRRRDHGGLVFVDLRDRTGLVQLVFDPDVGADAHRRAHQLRPETVVSVSGTIVRRDPETVNPELATGAFEVPVHRLEVLSAARTPPFEIESFSGEVGEELRLRHRYLDLRRAPLQRALALRHAVTRTIRDTLDAEGFWEIETPLLTRSTPEGARDFLVPARLRPGSFYALPQSPQLFKQLLMCAGTERYYQLARCFRDEAQRADRQLDFTQLDIEMSFVTGDQVRELSERVIVAALATAGIEASAPFAQLSYDEALARYGTDRPDTRFGLEIAELTEALRGTEFKVFAKTIAAGGVVRGLNAGARELSRAELDGLIDFAQRWGAAGLVWAVVEEGGGWRSPTAKFLSEQEIAAVNAQLQAGEGDVLCIVADQPSVAARALGALRLELAERYQLVDGARHELCWIVDWPLLARDPDSGRWDPLHHPFTAPDGELDPHDPGAARAQAYDLVLDGVELGGGSIRINDPEQQQQVFDVLGIGPDEASERFGFLLEALRYGAPPHGGIAFGLDRLVALCAGAESIREVIAFPKSAAGTDPLTGAPAPVDEIQLRELGVRVAAARGPQWGAVTG